MFRRAFLCAFRIALMLATFIIALREGLEAALIVSIIATFLKNNGRKLGAMWLGVVAAILLSVGVGVGLRYTEHALPQAQQEAMETVIGAIAIVFVSSMILWMNKNARHMKREIEARAASAVSQTSERALVLMAFLAVLKEGFETAVFLLATFSAVQSTSLAAVGACLGLVVAAAIGWGLYVGGIRLNMGRFFSLTGFFLILVAAGLVVSALRTAHEAGWLNIGQETVANLSWLVRAGTVRSALITGVLGIPADPRAIEALGWFAYLAVILTLLYLPERFRLSSLASVRLEAALGGVLAAGALALALIFPSSGVSAPEQVALTFADGKNGSAAGSLTWWKEGGGWIALLSLAGQKPVSFPLRPDAAGEDSHAGQNARMWTVGQDVPAPGEAQLTLDQVIALSGGRVPTGFNPAQHPGPYQAAWSNRYDIAVWATATGFLDATGTVSRTVALTGSGFTSPRVLSPRTDTAVGVGDWSIVASDRQRLMAEAVRAKALGARHRLWGVEAPALLAGLGFLFIVLACFGWRRLSSAPGATMPVS